MPSLSKKALSCGVEPSPTPMIPIALEFDQLDARAVVTPMMLEQIGRHPAGGAATQNDDRTRSAGRSRCAAYRAAIRTSPAFG